ncbi:hypothetical protein AVEN_46728-1 [Araneus ventricosus]|uniref:Uncharacterized protein n=1 Tax=Araneus ventricosus TaxID=182803 RepID=A0A4Y2X1W8_ARAVE|nr:hypothetical protein AVEN_46728-1 [Araneus ventricosus]
MTTKDVRIAKDSKKTSATGETGVNNLERKDKEKESSRELLHIYPAGGKSSSAISGVAILEISMVVRPFHECTVNIGNPVKHQIYDIAAAGKRSCKNGTNDDCRESLNVTDVQPFRRLLQISMLGHQQVSACEPFNETSSIWAFGAEGPFVYP